MNQNYFLVSRGYEGYEMDLIDESYIFQDNKLLSIINGESFIVKQVKIEEALSEKILKEIEDMKLEIKKKKQIEEKIKEEKKLKKIQNEIKKAKELLAKYEKTNGEKCG